MRNATIPRTVAAVRRAHRKVRRRLVRREAQLREAQQRQTLALETALYLRDRNAGLAHKANDILYSSRKLSESIEMNGLRFAENVRAQAVAKAQRTIAVSGLASVLLFALAVWGVFK